jgi:hypothetical protein
VRVGAARWWSEAWKGAPVWRVARGGRGVAVTRGLAAGGRRRREKGKERKKRKEEKKKEKKEEKKRKSRNRKK